MIGSLNPDPLRPSETDDIMPAAEYVAGYDAGWHDSQVHRAPLLHATAFGLGLVVGMFIAVVLILGPAVARG